MLVSKNLLGMTTLGEMDLQSVSEYCKNDFVNVLRALGRDGLDCSMGTQELINYVNSKFGKAYTFDTGLIQCEFNITDTKEYFQMTCLSDISSVGADLCETSEEDSAVKGMSYFSVTPFLAVKLLKIGKVDYFGYQLYI